MVKESDSIGVGGGQIEIVQDGQHRCAARGKIASDPHNQLLVTDVERAGRLVEQEDRGLLCEHPRQADPLLLATGESGEDPLGQIECVGCLQRVLDGQAMRVWIVSALAVMRVAAHRDNLLDRERKLKDDLLGQDGTAQSKLVWPIADQRVTVKEHPTLGWR